MRLRRLDFLAWGPFEGVSVPFDERPKLEVVYGPNERGKSSALRGVKALLFGIRQRTTDNHRFDNAVLRIGASLLNDKDEVVEVVRRKALKKTLIRPDGTAFDTDAIVAGYSEEEFEHLFGFDHETLRKSGEELTKGKGAYASTLWAATTGYLGAQRLLDALDDEAQSIFGPTKRSSSLNKLLDDHRALEKRASESTTTPQAWRLQVAALEDCDQRLLLLRNQEASLETERRRAQYQLDVTEQYARVSRLEEQIAPMSHVPVVASEQVSRVARAVEGEAEALRTLAEIDARHAAFGGELLAMGEPAGLLALEASILALVSARSLADEARSKIAPLGSRLRHLEQETNALSLGLADELVAAAPRVTRAIAAEASSLADASSDLTRDRQALVAERKRLSDELRVGAGREGGDTNASKRASLEEGALLVAECQSLRELRARAAVENARLQEHLLALGLMATRQLLVPPTQDEADAWILRDERRRGAAEALVRDKVLATKALHEATEALATLEAAVPVVAPHALATAREARDHAWLALGSGIATEATFLEAASRVDNLVDVLLASADALAEARRLRHVAATLVNSIDSLTKALCEHEAEAFKSQTEIAERLFAWGVAPSSPQEAAAWVRRLHEATDTRSRILELATTLADAEATFTARFARVAEAAGFAEASDLARVSVLSDAAKRELSLVDQRAGEVREVQLRLAHALERQRAVDEEITALDEREGDLIHQGNRLLTSIVIASESPLGLMVEFARAERVGILRAESEAVSAELSRLEEIVSRFEQGLTVLGHAVSAPPTIDTLERVSTKLREETAREARRSYLRGKVDDLVADRASAGAGLANVRSELSSELLPLGLENAHAFVKIRDQIAMVATLRSEREREEAALFEKQQLEPQFAAETHGEKLSASELRAQIESAVTALRETRAQRDDLLAERVACELGLRQFDKGSTAAEIALEASMLAADVEAQARQYARLKAASVLLRASLSRNQRECESPLLGRANTFFLRLTQGAYEAMRVELGDKGEAELKAITRGRRARGPGELSEGTRNQMFLALKLASVENACKERSPMPLVLDDVLVHFDDERSDAALETLAELSSVTQVLLFTHHRRVADFASTLPDARVREL